jgi:hypothetical protein
MEPRIEQGDKAAIGMRNQDVWCVLARGGEQRPQVVDILVNTMRLCDRRRYVGALNPRPRPVILARETGNGDQGKRDIAHEKVAHVFLGEIILRGNRCLPIPGESATYFPQPSVPVAVDRRWFSMRLLGGESEPRPSATKSTKSLTRAYYALTGALWILDYTL